MRRKLVRSAAFGLVLASAALCWAANAEKLNGDKPGAKKTSDVTALPGLGAFSFTSKKEPIEITSEKLDFDYKARRVVFQGNVEVVQGEIHLLSNVLTVDYAQVGDNQQLKEVTADGRVTITQGPRKATGNHAVFDQASRTMVLTGDAVLEEGANQVNGDKIVVHPDDSRMEVLGQNRRVKVVLFPGQGPLAQDGSGQKPSLTPGPGSAPTPVVKPRTESNGPGKSS